MVKPDRAWPDRPPPPTASTSVYRRAAHLADPSTTPPGRVCYPVGSSTIFYGWMTWLCRSQSSRAGRYAGRGLLLAV
ncbi:hypothetical protein HBB16_20515 [Pseudonocardia sp. MCCB 268]|nr:hypothetical protein [Pseudonocardia cytotoxica]